MSEFFFIRHGETDWNVKGLMQGSTDITLNDNGRAQAKAARDFLIDVGITRIISSPLVRAFETAKILNETLGLPLDTHAGLTERSFGIYEGHQRGAAPNVNGHVSDGEPHERIEAFTTVAQRASTAIAQALETHTSDRILFVSHGGVFSAIHDYHCGGRIGCNNAVPYHFRKEKDLWCIQEIKIQGADALRNAAAFG
jgi:probable phosphoglycerate mutase